jgi:predicted PolB exonuclease-like 3'-5' exonuclease
MKHLYFDVETVPDIDRIAGSKWWQLKEPMDYAGCKAVLDPAAIVSKTVKDVQQALVKMGSPDSQWIAEAKAAENAAKCRVTVLNDLDAAGSGDQSAMIKAASVSPELCKIVSIAFAVNEAECGVIYDKEMENAEIEGLETFWQLMTDARPVGYNCLGFDLPVIMVRSMIHGIRPTRQIDLGRYSKDVTDLFIKRFPSGAGLGPGGLKDVAGAMGIQIPVDDVDGGGIWSLYNAGEFDKIAAYNKSDVELTRSLHNMYRGYFCY